ncbi:hypothetical protein ABZ801_21880 [Actinomadura sp. NPDC047616]|uniref:hypothetical protein n=1 Tax=Actinomadura sp. NPDC047616 TaxID=3155914 RepID=UPI003401D931
MPAPPRWSTWRSAVIGLDEATGEFSMLYAYGVWRMWHAAPGFHQRFTGELNPGADTVHARCESSEDGTTWTPDFAHPHQHRPLTDGTVRGGAVRRRG